MGCGQAWKILIDGGSLRNPIFRGEFMKNLYWMNYLKRVTWTVCRFKGAYTPMHTMTYFEEQTK